MKAFREKRMVFSYPMTDPWDWYIYLVIQFKPYKSTKCTGLNKNLGFTRDTTKNLGFPEKTLGFHENPEKS